MNDEGELLIAFKDAWLQLIKDSSEWDANQPQNGFGPKTPEFIYRPSGNQFGLDVWHHPEFLSVRDRGGIKPGHLSALDEASLKASFPNWICPKRHEVGSLYLNAAAPKIDMSADFAVEQMRVEEGMKIARRALDHAEAAILRLARISK